MKLDKILIINPFGIGDALFTTPLIRRLKRQFPASSLGFICNSRTAPLLYGNKNLDEVFVFDKGAFKSAWQRSKLSAAKQFFGLLKTVRSGRFDAAIDLSLGSQYGFFLLVLGVPARLGYNFKGRGRFLTHKIDIAGYSDKHIVEYYIDLFRFFCKTAGVQPLPAAEEDALGADIFLAEENHRWAEAFLRENGISGPDRLLAVIPGGGASWGKAAIYKRWQAEDFAAAAGELAGRLGFKAILFGSREEADLCRQISSAMAIKPVFACGRTDILQFAALLKRCEIAICNDGGPLHIAAAAGIKTVSLFGPVDEKVYGPYPPGPGHIVIKQSLDCRPCYSRFKFTECDDRRCLLNIRPQDVVGAAEAIIA